MAKEKLNTYWGEVSTLHLPKIATIERNFISISFYSIIANRVVTKNRYRSLISSSLHLCIANRLALATSFLLLLIPSFLVPSSLHSQIPSYVPTNGLVGYWPFNGNANDESGNNLGGNVLGGPTLTTDRNGNSNTSYDFDFSTVSFGGQTDEIYIPFNSILNSTSISVSVWVYPRSYDWSGNPGGSTIIVRYEYGYSNPNGQTWGMGFNQSSLSAFILEGASNNSQNSATVSHNNPLSLNTWHHIVFTYNEATLDLYLNGVLVNSVNASLPLNTAGNSGISIGESNQANGYWYPTDGKIDDIAIYNRALTQEEITALYNGTTNTSIAGCTNSTACNYNASATQDDGSCTYPTQTYLNCAGTCINDADNDGICDELETPTLPSYLPSNGLVGYWPFNGNANDESGNGNHGTMNNNQNGTITFDTDRNNVNSSCVNFTSNPSWNTNGPYIEISNNNSLMLNNSYTIVMWVKVSSTCQTGELLNKGNDDIGFFSRIQYPLAGVAFGSAGGYIDYSLPINTSEWMMLCFSRNGNNTMGDLHINGTLVSSGFINSPISNSDNIAFGAMPGGGTNGSYYPFQGLMDDIAIYNRALSQEEITALYNGTTNGGGGGNGGTAGTPAPSVPQGIPYQAMIRDNNGAALVNTPVIVRFSLRQDAIDGTVEYQETHNLTTNAFGLVNTHFGSGSATQGTFANINWSNTTKFIQVEANSGAGFVEMGTQQMMSVPFALKANSANEANKVKNAGLPVYANNAAALAGGLVAGDMYRTAGGVLMVVY